MVDGAKLHEGVWLPLGEKHLVEMMSPKAKRFTRLPDGRASYQRHKYLAALPFVKQRKVFVDIGAHVGLWSMQAVLDFEKIVAFEPHPLHANLYEHNMQGQKYTLHRVALGDRKDSIALKGEPGSSGDTHVAGPGDIQMRTLDSYRLRRIDLLKIDTEGYELPILKGAVETLKRCRPVIVVEQKGRDVKYHGGKPGEAAVFLRELGWTDMIPPISGDHIMGCVNLDTQTSVDA
jgi:FkbM family methyltransferase